MTLDRSGWRPIRGLQGTLLLLQLVVLVPVLLLQAGLYYGRFQAQQAAELQANFEVARAVASAFDAYLDDVVHQEFTLGIALSAPRPLPSEEANRLLATSASQYPSLRHYCWLDPRGRVLASSRSQDLGADFGDRPYVQEIVRGQESTVSDLFLGPSSGEPTFAIARGIRDEKRGLQGIVAASVEPRLLGDMLKIERSGQAAISIIDRQGRLVYRYPELELAWEQRQVDFYPPSVVLSGWAATGALDAALDPEERVGGSASVASIGWVASASRPTREVVAPVVQDLLREFGLISLVAALATLIALVTGRRLTAPLDRLREQALAIGRGEFDAPVKVAGPTEQEDLADAFNQMAGELRVREERRDRLLDELRECNQQQATDFTRNRELAERAEAARSEAERQAAQLNALLDSVAEAVMVVDSKGHISLMNQVAQEIMGMSVEQAEDLFASHQERLLCPDGTPLSPEEWPTERALRGERFTNVDAMFLRPDGGRRCLVFSGGGVRDSESNVVLAIVVCHDVTERRQLERRREEYVSLISHDLRAPLTVVLGQAQMIQRAADRVDLVRKSADAVITGARRMNVMIQDLVDSARLESGQLKLNSRPVELRVFVLELKDRLVGVMEVERLRVEVPEDPMPVLADQDRLERILVNLLSNALKYSTPDTEVTVRLVQSTDEVVVSVSDLGPGIPPEEMPNLFQRYGRMRKNREDREGLGLGLYITRMLVEAHGGRIWAESVGGEGSTFHFTLPSDTSDMGLA